jgi:hypothetical protein
MDLATILLAAGAVIFGALWMMRRRARLRSDKYE